MGKISLKLLITVLLLFTSTNSKLEQVVSFFRHGARYALNSYYDGNDTKYTWGELTSVGMRQHQALGEILRKEYIDKLAFLSPNFDRNQIQIYSTESNRTVQSVISQLYGLYPPGTGPSLLQVNPSFYLPPYSNKTDLPDHTTPLPHAHQIIPLKFDQHVMMDTCVQQTAYANKNIEVHRQEYSEMNITYWSFVKKMSNIYNLTGNVTFGTLSSLLGDLQCDRYLNRPLPKEMTQVDYVNLQHLDSWYKQFIFVDDLAKACNRDRFVKILNMFDGRINNPTQQLKWTFLSGHDNNMSPMYTDLNISSSQCIEQLYRKNKTSSLNCQAYPSFSASIIFQLHSNSGEYSVKIRSNGKYMNLCGEKSLQCSYTNWKKRILDNMASVELAQTICGKKTNGIELDKAVENKGNERRNRFSDILRGSGRL